MADRRGADGLTKAGRRVVKVAVNRTLQRPVQSQKLPSAPAVPVPAPTARAAGTSPARRPSQTTAAAALQRTPRVVLTRLKPEQIPAPPVQRKIQPSRAAHSRHLVIRSKPGLAQVKPHVSRIRSRVAIHNKPSVIQNKRSLVPIKPRLVPLKPRVAPIKPGVVPGQPSVGPGQPQVVMLKQVNGAAPLPRAVSVGSLPGGGSTLLRVLTHGWDPPKRKLKVRTACSHTPRGFSCPPPCPTRPEVCVVPSLKA